MNTPRYKYLRMMQSKKKNYKLGEDRCSSITNLFREPCTGHILNENCIASRVVQNVIYEKDSEVVQTGDDGEADQDQNNMNGMI